MQKVLGGGGRLGPPRVTSLCSTPLSSGEGTEAESLWGSRGPGTTDFASPYPLIPHSSLLGSRRGRRVIKEG